MRNGRRTTIPIRVTLLKGTLVKPIIVVALILSIPVSLFLAAGAGLTVKYETELGKIPAYTDPADIPKDPEKQRAFQQEIHARLVFTFYLLWYWWIPAIILLPVLFVHSLRNSEPETP